MEPAALRGEGHLAHSYKKIALSVPLFGEWKHEKGDFCLAKAVLSCYNRDMNSKKMTGCFTSWINIKN